MGYCHDQNPLGLNLVDDAKWKSHHPARSMTPRDGGETFGVGGNRSQRFVDGSLESIGSDRALPRVPIERLIKFLLCGRQ
jgi:hypothetical protein